MSAPLRDAQILRFPARPTCASCRIAFTPKRPSEALCVKCDAWRRFNECMRQARALMGSL